MSRRAPLFLLLIILIFCLAPDGSWSQKAEPTITDFKVEAMYRSAKVTWKIKRDMKNDAAVQILRADSFEDEPYQEVAVVKIIRGKSSYEYIDKSMGSESKYYYKLRIKETDESFGPKPTRPFFSPPAT